jgi:thymidylate synthase (FAD)
MNVTLLQCTPLNIAVEAALTCTASVDKLEERMWDGGINFLSKMINSGHESVIEHIVMTWRIEGISRAVLQEMARHRLVSLSVESTRWALHKVLKRGANFYLPKVILDSPEYTEISFAIATLAQLALREQSERGNDSAKYLLPECLTTNLILTCNLREFRHIYKLRTSGRALHEFQEIAFAMADALPEEHGRLVRL